MLPTKVQSTTEVSSHLKNSRAHTIVKRKTSLKLNLMNDYGLDIHTHLKKIESDINLDEFLGKHNISKDYRAKMVDWIVEVLTTFKTSEQTFFLTINILDRYFKNSEKNLSSSDLHISGVVAMFIASKYEDVIPILMRTVINKIGHGKFEVPQIEDKELEVLKTIGFKIGAPTIKEFLDRYCEELADILPKTDRFKKICTFIARMTSHNYTLMQISTSLLAAGILNFGLQASSKVDVKVDVDKIMEQVADFAHLNLEDVKETTKQIVAFAKNFEKLHPNLKNLKTFYSEDFKVIKTMTG